MLVTSTSQEKLESRSVRPLLRPANMHLHGHFPLLQLSSVTNCRGREGEITVITSLSGPECRRGDGLRVFKREISLVH